MSTVNLSPTVDVRRAEDRFSSQLGWLDSKHSFSFGRHYDRANTHHGLLLVNNDDVVDAGTGFETHPHRDMEIVTWVLRRLAGPPGLHRSQRGHLPRPRPADERRHAASCTRRRTTPGDWPATAHRDPVHFVQMWVVPDEAGITPGYEQLEIDDELLAGGLVPVASGMDKHDGAVRDPDQEPVRRPARRPAAARPERRAARGAVPAPVRARGVGRPRGRRGAGHRRRGPVHRDRRAAGHRHRAGRDPGLGDARHHRRLTSRPPPTVDRPCRRAPASRDPRHARARYVARVAAS